MLCELRQLHGNTAIGMGKKYLLIIFLNPLECFSLMMQKEYVTIVITSISEKLLTDSTVPVYESWKIMQQQIPPTHLPSDISMGRTTLGRQTLLQLGVENKG